MKTNAAGVETFRVLTANYRSITDTLSRGDALEVSSLSQPPAQLELDLAGAYALQESVNEHLVQEQQFEPVGYKVSMTADEDRVPVDANDATYGVIFSHQILAARAELRLDQTNDMLLEPELVFRTVQEISDNFNFEDLTSVLEVTAGLEIPMSRVPSWFPPGALPNLDLATFIADNSAAGYVACGAQWVSASQLDTSQVEVLMVRPDGTKTEGSATRVMGAPLNSIRWLFERLLARQGSIPAGTLISSGTFMPPQRPDLGTFEAKFSHELGSITVTFNNHNT